MKQGLLTSYYSLEAIRFTRASHAEREAGKL